MWEEGEIEAIEGLVTPQLGPEAPACRSEGDVDEHGPAL